MALGIERLRGFGQEVWRHLNTVYKEVAPVNAGILHEKAVNLYNHMYKLVESVGVFEGDHFTSWEERAFFTERVAARFLEDIFPEDDSPKVFHPTLNDKRNKIDRNQLVYTRQFLPNTFVPSPSDLPEQIALEQLIDQTAIEVYLVLHRDIKRRGKADDVVLDFQRAIKGQEVTSSYVTWGDNKREVRRGIQQVLEEYKEKKSPINNVVETPSDQLIYSPA